MVFCKFSAAGLFLLPVEVRDFWGLPSCHPLNSWSLSLAFIEWVIKKVLQTKSVTKRFTENSCSPPPKCINPNPFFALILCVCFWVVFILSMLLSSLSILNDFESPQAPTPGPKMDIVIAYPEQVAYIQTSTSSWMSALTKGRFITEAGGLARNASPKGHGNKPPH